MATVTTNNSITTELGKISGFFKAHERLIVIVLLIAAGFFGYEKYLNHEEAVAKQQAAQTAQVLAQQQATDAQLATQSKAASDAAAVAIAQYQQMVAQLTAQNSQLAASIAQRDAALKTQQQQNATLGAAAMATRIASDEKLPPADVTADANSNVILDSLAAHQILNDLDSLPIANQNVNDLTAEKTNDEAEIKGLQDVVAKQQTQITDQGNQITGLTKALADSEANTVKQVALQKAADKKSRLSWFKGGVIVGFIAGVITGHYI